MSTHYCVTNTWLCHDRLLRILLRIGRLLCLVARFTFAVLVLALVSFRIGRRRWRRHGVKIQ